MTEKESVYEINKELVLSTANIPEKEALILDSLIDRAPWVSGYDYGYRLRVGADENYSQLPITFSLLEIAKSEGCKWLVLDQDAEIIPSLRSFGW